MRCPVARSIVCGFAYFRPAPFMPAHTTHGDDPHALAECIATHDFCFLPADHTKNGLASLEAGWNSDWERFAASWGSLERDTYMADGGRYRRRRYAVLSAPADRLDAVLEPHQPHYQSLDYNNLNGGVARHFAPIAPEVMQGATMQTAIRLGLGVFQRLHPGAAAHIEVHQFRIEALPDGAGKPTPEGVHRDGVDFVLVMMVRRENVESGTTEIFSPEGDPLDSFTLTAPCDAALVNDQRALHGVTPIHPLDPSKPAWRDVLVVTYRRAMR
jgi:hypothetical protein